MAKPRSSLIADSLARVSRKARDHIVRSADMSRTDRQRLLAAGYLQRIIKGWYLLTTPDAGDGESTAWFASYWSFLACYLNDRFGSGYCLGAETSMELHLKSPTIPRQVTVITDAGGQTVIELPHNVSLLTYQDPDNLPDAEDTVTLYDGQIRAMSLPLALARIAPSFFERRPRDADIALRMVPTAADLARVLVKGRWAAAAERLIGACRFLDLAATADEIASEMEIAGFEVKPANPFRPDYDSGLSGTTRIVSPHTARLRAMWMAMRETVLATFPDAPGPPPDAEAYLQSMDEKYENDAFNSLSIEGYRVTPELISRMRTGDTGVRAGETVSMTDAMAAKGYSRAFKLVKEGVRRILDGESPGLTLAEYLHTWYRALFSPNVDAGLLKEHDLIGYRRQPVYIKGSLHVPPPGPAVPDCMNVFLDLVVKEGEPGVRTVMGHFMFVFIHPYMDGNGRLARFVMNAMLASGGYPWTVVPMARRADYMQALEKASVGGDIEPFSRFLGSLVAGK